MKKRRFLVGVFGCDDVVYTGLKGRDDYSTSKLMTAQEALKLSTSGEPIYQLVEIPKPDVKEIREQEAGR